MSDNRTVRVGCLGYTGRRRSYWKALRALEIGAEQVETVKAGTLARWRDEAPANARFIPVVPPALAASGFGEAGLPAWQRAVEVAEALGADTVLLTTPASFRPTAANRARLTAFFKAHRPEGLRVAWWAEGLWESQPEDRDETCVAAGIHPAIDPLGLDDDEEPPEGGWVYWRLMGRKGLAPRYTDYEIDTLLDLLMEHDEGYVIFTAPTMFTDARRLAQLAAIHAEADGELDD